MKKLMIFVATAMLMTSCGMLKGSSSSTASTTTSAASTTSTAASTTTSTDPTTAGQGAGNALHALYTQYKADGNKFNYKNTQNILNTVTLIANCEGLKDNYKDKSYLTNFGKGLIASSMGLVTQSNVTTVTNSLVDMIKNSETVQNAQTTVQTTASTAAGYASTAAQYASSLSTLLSAFSGK